MYVSNGISYTVTDVFLNIVLSGDLCAQIGGTCLGRQKSILHSIIIIPCINFGSKSKIKNFLNTEIYFLNICI